jgi:DNA modification methylase
MKKQQDDLFKSLEESPLSGKTSITQSQKVEHTVSNDPLVICPQCGGHALATAHVDLHSGNTFYCCSGKCGEYYFTPQTKEIDEKLKIYVSEEISVSSKYDQENLFNTEAPKKATGKTIESLEYSRAQATAVMRRFKGALPQSVMRADRKSRREADLSTGSYDASSVYFGVWQNSSRGCANGALSAFPQNIGRCCVELYSERMQTVIDPFAGHNSRMELCVKAHRHYIGFDVSARFMQFNRERAKLLREQYSDVEITLHEADSRKMSEYVEQWSGNFTITSPPYYDIEDYGDEHSQLGKATSYAEFLRALSRVAEQNFRALKSKAFCVWFVNDFRRDATFHAYHIDVFNLLRAAGFTAWDIMITDFGSSFGQCFPAQVMERKILPKRHEYGLVMRKL